LHGKICGKRDGRREGRSEAGITTTSVKIDLRAQKIELSQEEEKRKGRKEEICLYFSIMINKQTKEGARRKERGNSGKDTVHRWCCVDCPSQALKEEVGDQELKPE